MNQYPLIHHPFCDINDHNPYGITKPCNCGLDALQQRAERAEACVAEMRDAFLSFVGDSGWQIKLYLHEQFPATQGHKPLNDWLDRMVKAAATYCGQGWASPETVAKWEKEREHCRQQAANWEARTDKLQAENQLMREALEKIANQGPSKPDYWSACEQCESNIDEAKETLAKLNP